MTEPTEPTREPAPEPEQPITDLLRGLVQREAAAVRRGAEARPPVVRYVGDYEVIEEIARGGMGVVYRARQANLDRDVALKMVLDGALANEEAIARFQSEAQAAAKLRHPGIVPIFEIGEHEGRPYFAMELVEGESLASVLREGPLAPAQAAGYVASIARAVQYAHEQGILHRDLKPSNVLLDAGDRPRITDFGLAKRMDDEESRTITGAVLGTPSYMSPEQARGRSEAIGPASDVYSLGTLLYELLTGRPPFQSSNPMETLQQVLESQPASPRVLNPGLPEDLERVCLKCLEKQPAQRYASAEELAQDLDRFLAGEPVLARPAGLLRRAWSEVRRRPWIVASVLSLGLVVSLALGFWGWTRSAYLQHLIENPDYVREDGPRAQRLEDLSMFISMTWLVGLWLLNIATVDSPRFLRMRANPRRMTQVGLAACATFLVAMVAAGMGIDAYVWEGVDIREVLYAILALQIAAMAAFFSFRTAEARLRGPATDLSDEQELSLLEILKEGPKREFRKRMTRVQQQYDEWMLADPAQRKKDIRNLWVHAHIASPATVPPAFETRSLIWGLLFGAVFVWILFF